MIQHNRALLLFAASPLIWAATSTTVIDPVVGPVVYGKKITLSAGVTPSVATGRITWYDGVVVLGSAPLTGGRASLTISNIGSGARTLQARYGGDVNYQSSVSRPLILPVDGPSQNTLSAAVPFASVRSPGPAVACDFNGDGKPDIAVVALLENAAAVMLGKGDGTVGPVVPYRVGTLPLGLVCADFNSDGRPDIATVNRDTNNISVLLGVGDGTFADAVSYAAGIGPGAIITADFNGDGIVDIAVASTNSGNVFVLLGVGNGTFKPQLSSRAAQSPLLMAVSDFNGDGIVDIVVPNRDIGALSVLLGKGDGTFQSPATYPLNGLPASVTVGDFNRDGADDVAVALFDKNSVGILLGNGDGTLRSASYFPVGTLPNSITAADFNGDGFVDLVVMNSGGNTVSVHLAAANGTFLAALTFLVGSQPVPPVVTDLNGDGRNDLVVPNSISDNILFLRGVALYPDLSPSVAHSGTFTKGQTGAQYSITVSNVGAGLTVDETTVKDTLPLGLTATALSGAGWTCRLTDLTCSRFDRIASGAKYPPIILTVNISGTAAGSLTNLVTVAGGGEVNTANNQATDQADIVSGSTGPSLIEGGVLNGANFAKGADGKGAAIAPGSIVSVYGSFPGAASAVAANVPYPFSLGGVSMTFNGIPAPIISVVVSGSTGFVNVQAPFGVLPSGKDSAAVDVVVTTGGLASPPMSMLAVSAAPGIFTIPPDGLHNAVLVYIDSNDGIARIAAPESVSIGFPSRPIERGQSGYFYVTGLGAMTPPVPDNSGGLEDSGVLHSSVFKPKVWIGDVEATVQFAGQAPGFAGVGQINIAVPANAPVGDAVAIRIVKSDGSIAPGGATIAIR